MDNSRQTYDLTLSIEQINEIFNNELQMQVEGLLPKGHIYCLGLPSNILKSTGFPYIPIELSSTRLEEKSKQKNHPYEISEVRNMVLALNVPLAIFSYGDKEKSQNVIIELEYKGKKFLLGTFFNQFHRNVAITDIRGLFPKDTCEWLNWISQGKALYLDKKKIQILINQQRINLAEVEYLDLDLIESIIDTFQNPL